jgi:hypothetical protein
MSIAIVHLTSNGERMTYEVTTTVTITRKHMVEADGEETAKEQAETLTMRWIMCNARGGKANDYGTNKTLHIEQDAVEITSPNDEAKKYI